jgi:hypothetical protein
VVVCNAQSVRRNERAAAAGIKAHARFLEMIEPLRRRLELILLFKLFQWRIVEQPHALIAKGPAAESNEQEQTKDCGKKFAHPAA